MLAKLSKIQFTRNRRRIFHFVVVHVRLRQASHDVLAVRSCNGGSIAGVYRRIANYTNFAIFCRRHLLSTSPGTTMLTDDPHVDVLQCCLRRTEAEIRRFFHADVSKTVTPNGHLRRVDDEERKGTRWRNGIQQK